MNGSDLIRFHISSCDHLIMGGTHDKGYGNILHQLNEWDRQKVVLLQTTSLLTKHTAALKLPTVGFPGLFSVDLPRMPPAARAFGKKSAPTTTDRTLQVPSPDHVPPLATPLAVKVPPPVSAVPEVEVKPVRLLNFVPISTLD